MYSPTPPGKMVRLMIALAMSPDPTPQRVVRLGTLGNLRDLGGYAAQDGRTLRWGVLFRSGALERADAHDRAYLSTLGVRVACDLRVESERRQRPSAWLTAGREQRSWPGPEDRRIADVWQGGYPDTVAGMRAKMIAIYQAIPFWLASRLRGLFACLVSAELPLVFHCSLGKDRSGVAAALILSALAVPEETIFADYLLSNEVLELDRQTAEWMQQTPPAPGSVHPFGKLPQEVRRALLQVDADYLRAALAEIQRRHGSVERYLESELGVGPAERAVLAQTLLSEAA